MRALTPCLCVLLGAAAVLGNTPKPALITGMVPSALKLPVEVGPALTFGSPEYKAAVPRMSLLRHVLLTHVSYLVSIGIVQTAVYTCLPHMRDAGLLTHAQITHMLTAGTCAYVFGKLSTAQVLDLIHPKAAFMSSVLAGCIMCLSLASGASGGAAMLAWAAYKFVSATAWPALVQMLQFWTSRADSVKAWSLYATASRTGAVTATMAVGLLMQLSSSGWRLALGATGIASALILLLIRFSVDETPTGVIVSATNARVSGGLRKQEEADEPAAAAQQQPPVSRRGGRGRGRDRRRPLLRSYLGPPPTSQDEEQLRDAWMDESVHLKPKTLLRLFARRPNFWLALAASMGYSPIRQFEALIPLYLREARGQTSASAIDASAAATAYHLGYWLSAGFGNPFYARLAQGYQLCLVFALLACHAANLLFMAWAERPGSAGLSAPLQALCMYGLGATIAVPATGVLNIFAMDMGKADGSAMLTSLQDAAGATGSVVFLRVADALRARHGWSGVLLLLAGCSAWTLLCESTLLFRDFLKFRKGYVVNPVRTRRSVPPPLREVYPRDELER